MTVNQPIAIRPAPEIKFTFIIYDNVFIKSAEIENMIFAKRSLSLALILTLLATFGEAALVTWSRSGSCTENFVNAVTTPIHQIDDALTSGLTASEEAPMLDSLQVVEQAHHEYSTGCFEQGFDIVPSTTRQVRGLPQPTLQQTVNPTQPLFNGCPAVGLTGSGAPPPQDMSELNLKKNRTDSPVGDIYQPISFHTFVDLPWSAGAMQQRAFAEGFPVAIEGYLGWVESQARESNNCTNDLATPTPNKISCNSHTGQPQENVDFHIWLLDYPVVGLDH
ncbi:MAG: hypothetical protein GC204_09435, partial [Chloroflexi bacterium]|nr:hypothetical protein [Chloroflexota bacterium]